MLDSGTRAVFRETLLRWYKATHRKLPWRAEPGRHAHPYHVLVSEAMLQQTQVATVIGFFNRFIERWPTVEALAEADEQQVLRAWQGLGYYRRAQCLHRAAKRIVGDFDGQVPCGIHDLRALPGVGQYSAGAIASMAFGKPEPAVDGNIARVLGRAMNLTEPIDSPAGRKALWGEAGKLVKVPPSLAKSFHAGDVNQALMELGATTCTPRGPMCLVCPVVRWCGAARQNKQNELPVRSNSTQQKAVVHQVLALCHDGRWLFEQRDQQGLWAGMWQMPTVEHKPGERPAGGRELTQWTAQRYGLTVAGLSQASAFDHQTTHRKIRFIIWLGRINRNGRMRREAHWRALSELDEMPMSNPQRRAILIISSGA